MRWRSRTLAGSLMLTLLVLVFSPLLLCGGGPMDKPEAGACCRAMHFRCHTKSGLSSCCEQKTVSAAQVTLSAAHDSVSIQPALAWIVLVDALPIDPWAARANSRIFSLFPSHSPPQAAPLFLQHRTFLI